MSFCKEVVIDGRGHIQGRLASTVAKQVLNGQRVTVVRCEAINMSASLFRHQLKRDAFNELTNNVNPKQGPFHYRAPAKIFFRLIRGMIPHKTARGQAALDRLTLHDGCPHPYDMKKKMVIPSCLKILRVKPYRKFCVLGDLAEKAGWKQKQLTATLEARRKTRAQAWHTKRVAANKVKKNNGKKAKLGADEKALLAKIAI